MTMQGIAPLAGAAAAASMASRGGGAGADVSVAEIAAIIASIFFALYVFMTMVTWTARLTEYGDGRTLANHVYRQWLFVRKMWSRLW